MRKPSSRFREYLNQNSPKSTLFDQDTLESFFDGLTKANDMVIQARSFIAWSYPMGYSIGDEGTRTKFEEHRDHLVYWVDENTVKLESHSKKIAAILVMMNQSLWETTKEKLL